MSLLQEVEQKIEAAFKQLTDNQSLLNQKIQQIKQLTSDKLTITALVHQLNGYIAAHQEVKKSLAPVAAPAASTPVEAPAEAASAE